MLEVNGMPLFKVERVLDGNVFQVETPWSWDNQTGREVRIYGYQPPLLNEPGGLEAQRKLSAILFEASVELTTAYGCQDGKLLCEVYLRGRNIAELFPEYGDVQNLGGQ